MTIKEDLKKDEDQNSEKGENNSTTSGMMEIIITMIILTILMISIVTFLGDMRRKKYDDLNEKHIIYLADVMKNSEKKMLDVVKVKLLVENKDETISIVISGNTLDKYLLEGMDIKCLKGQSYLENSYEVYGYQYVFNNETKIHIPKVCENLKIVESKQ